MPEQTPEAMPFKYTEGVCGDGAAILKDGVPMTIAEILADLNKRVEPGPGTAEAFWAHFWSAKGRMARVIRLRSEAEWCRERAARCADPELAAYWRREAAICDRVADANMPRGTSDA